MKQGNTNGDLLSDDETKIFLNYNKCPDCGDTFKYRGECQKSSCGSRFVVLFSGKVMRISDRSPDMISKGQL